MSVFERTAKINRLLALGVSVATAAALVHPAVAGSDLWWHLASGREIWALGAVPRFDVFSFTYFGREWMNHEWLWDVIFWGLYSIHPEAVPWTNFGVIVAAYTFVFLASRRASDSSLGAGVAIVGAAAAAHWFIDLRPHVITLMLVGLLLLTRDRPWAPLLWPPLMVAWTNLHGGFTFGLGAIGLHVGAKTLRDSLEQRRLAIPGLEWSSLGLCILATLVNPFGYRTYEYPLAYLNSASPYRTLIEWKAPDWSFDLSGFEGRFTLLCLAALPGFLVSVWGGFLLLVSGLAPISDPNPARRGAHGRSRRGQPEATLALRARNAWKRLPAGLRDPYFAALAGVCLAMAVTSRRFIPLFGIVAAPLIACSIGPIKRLGGRLWPPLDGVIATWAGCAAAAALATLLWSQVRLVPDFLARWTEATLYPEAAIRYLKSLGTVERVLNYYNWGGYLMLHYPEAHTFIDGRANTLYDDKIYIDYIAMLSGRRGVGARLAQYPPADVALLPTSSALSRTLASSLGWKALYADRVAVILAPPESPFWSLPRPRVEDILGDHPDTLLMRAGRLQAQGNESAAIREIERAIEINPQLIRAYSQLADIHARRGDFGSVERTIQRGLREAPRRQYHLRVAESSAYQRYGYTERALAAARRARSGGPFAAKHHLERMIEELERKLAADGGVP